MKGKQQITLSHDSVKEALQDYLHKHMAPNVFLSVSAWAQSVTYNEGTQVPPGVIVDFSQADVPAEGKSVDT